MLRGSRISRLSGRPLLYSEGSDTLRCAFLASNPYLALDDIIGKTMHGLVCGTARSSFIFSGVLLDVPRL